VFTTRAARLTARQIADLLGHSRPSSAGNSRWLTGLSRPRQRMRRDLARRPSHSRDRPRHRPVRSRCRGRCSCGDGAVAPVHADDAVVPSSIARAVRVIVLHHARRQRRVESRDRQLMVGHRGGTRSNVASAAATRTIMASCGLSGTRTGPLRAASTRPRRCDPIQPADAETLSATSQSLVPEDAGPVPRVPRLAGHWPGGDRTDQGPPVGRGRQSCRDGQFAAPPVPPDGQRRVRHPLSGDAGGIRRGCSRRGDQPIQTDPDVTTAGARGGTARARAGPTRGTPRYP
jgi:hypothetical protein